MKAVGTRLRALLLLLALSTFAVPALGQACAMCYVTAKSTPKDGQRALNRGILVLLVPPVGAMTLGVSLAFRYGKRRDSENDNAE